MSFFSKVTGGDKDGNPDRDDERIEADGESVSILPSKEKYEVVDYSLGGFCVKGYEGKLRGKQYLEFRFFGNKGGEEVKADGVATVIRVKDGELAVKFPPQPRLKIFLKDYANK